MELLQLLVGAIIGGLIFMALCDIVGALKRIESYLKEDDTYFNVVDISDEVKKNGQERIDLSTDNPSND